MWDRLIDHLIQEWIVATKAPFFSLVLVLIGLLCGWSLARLLSGEQLAVLKQRVADYQERLGLVPRNSTKYSKLTNRELKQQVTTLAAELRGIGARYLSEYRLSSDLWFEQMAGVETEDHRRQIMTRSEQRFHELREQRLAKYRRVRPKVVALRDEMLDRLPERPVEKIHVDGVDVVPFVNDVIDDEMLVALPNPLGAVAAFLEELAVLLP